LKDGEPAAVWDSGSDGEGGSVRGVVDGREVAEPDVLEVGVSGGANKVSGLEVGEVSMSVADALLEVNGVRAVGQHVWVVIGLEDGVGGRAEEVGELRSRSADIGGDQQASVVALEEKAGVVSGVVWEVERSDAEVSNEQGGVLTEVPALSRVEGGAP
jgi:hypothetical protein